MENRGKSTLVSNFKIEKEELCGSTVSLNSSLTIKSSSHMKKSAKYNKAYNYFKATTLKQLNVRATDKRAKINIRNAWLSSYIYLHDIYRHTIQFLFMAHGKFLPKASRMFSL